MDILNKVGGTLEIAYNLKIHQVTIERWRKIGIPEKHWGWFVGKGIAVEDLYKFNQDCRNETNTIR